MKASKFTDAQKAFVIKQTLVMTAGSAGVTSTSMRCLTRPIWVSH